MSDKFLEALLINEEDALRRLGGNAGLYGILLKKFLDNNYMEQYNQAIAQGDTKAEAENAHAIKGLAANLSLQRLCAAATEADAAYKQGIDPVELKRLLQGIYEDTLTAVREYIG